MQTGLRIGFTDSHPLQVDFQFGVLGVLLVQSILGDSLLKDFMCSWQQSNPILYIFCELD